MSGIRNVWKFFSFVESKFVSWETGVFAEAKFCLQFRCQKLNFLLNLFQFIWGNDRTATKIRKSVDLAWNVNKCISICSAMQWTSVSHAKYSVIRNRRKIVQQNSANSKAYSIYLQFECEWAESAQLCRLKSVFSILHDNRGGAANNGHLRWFAVAKWWIFLHGIENAATTVSEFEFKKGSSGNGTWIICDAWVPVAPHWHCVCSLLKFFFLSRRCIDHYVLWYSSPNWFPSVRHVYCISLWICCHFVVDAAGFMSWHFIFHVGKARTKRSVAGLNGTAQSASGKCLNGEEKSILPPAVVNST